MIFYPPLFTRCSIESRAARMDSETKVSITRQPKWTEPELTKLYAIFKEWYKQDSPQQYFRMVQKELTHRTYSGGLKKIHEAQVQQLLPYYGALPVTIAREADAREADNIAYNLVQWMAKQKDAERKNKATAKSSSSEAYDSLMQIISNTLQIQNDLLSLVASELHNIRKFVAGVYRNTLSGEQESREGINGTTWIHTPGVEEVSLTNINTGITPSMPQYDTTTEGVDDEECSQRATQ